MLTVPDYIYYALYLFCLYTSFRANPEVLPGLRFLRIMLLMGLAMEVAVETLKLLHREHNTPYYAYIPVEYVCLTRFYRQNAEGQRLRRLLDWSVPVFLIAAVLLSVFHHRFTGYPSALYNVSCFFNAVWLSLLLFNFNRESGYRVWRHPLFIVFSALLIFCAGVFFFNPAYSYILKKDEALGKTLRAVINTGLNYILYTLLSYGFLCSAKTTK